MFSCYRSIPQLSGYSDLSTKFARFFFNFKQERTIILLTSSHMLNLCPRKRDGKLAGASVIFVACGCAVMEQHRRAAVAGRLEVL